MHVPSGIPVIRRHRTAGLHRRQATFDVDSEVRRFSYYVYLPNSRKMVNLQIYGWLGGSLLSSFVRLLTVAVPTALPYVFNPGYFIRFAYPFCGWPPQIKTSKVV